MRICVLDGMEIEDRKQLHAVLADSLGFPEWYGRNLDALCDCLTDLREEAEIRLLHREILEGRLGHYVQALEKVLHIAEEANPRVRYIRDAQKCEISPGD